VNTAGLAYEDHVRRLLAAIRAGDRTSFDTLIEAVGQEMRRLSAYHLRHRPADIQTLQTTALVNEAVIRLIQALDRQAERFPETHAHFMALASNMMRFTLIDYARKRKLKLVSLDEPIPGADRDEPGETTMTDALADWGDSDIELLMAVHEALAKVERLDSAYGKRRSTALGLRLFGGMNYAEIAEELGVTDDMARRDCQIALGRVQGMLTTQ
jgi:RNA polymerase sigma factor (TIGR02999 family)